MPIKPWVDSFVLWTRVELLDTDAGRLVDAADARRVMPLWSPFVAIYVLIVMRECMQESGRRAMARSGT